MQDIIRAALASHDLITVSQTFCAIGVEHCGADRWIEMYQVGIIDLDDGHWNITDEDSIRPVSIDELAAIISEANQDPASEPEQHATTH